MNDFNIDELKLDGFKIDMSDLPGTFRSKLEGSRQSWVPNAERREFFKKNFEGLYENFQVTTPKINRQMACFESLGENYLGAKIAARSIKLENSKLLPIHEAALNTTDDITNWPFIQMQLLRKIFFTNAFINLVSVQPARSRTGTYYKLDIQRPDGADASIFDKAAFDSSYADYTEGGTVNHLKLKLTNDSFTTSERALAAQVTDMLQQDLSSEHGMDAFMEIMPFLVKELNKIESTMLLDTLLAGSAGFASNVDWNQNGALTDDLKTSWGMKSYANTLVDSINGVGREIVKATGSAANWIYMDVDTWGIIEDSLQSLMKDANGATNLVSPTGASLKILGDPNLGTVWKGILNNRYDVYVDNSGHSGLQNKIIVGSTSDSWLYQGMVYIPYILGWAPGRLRSYDKIFEQKEGMLNRSGVKLINGKFYGTVTVTQS